MNIRIKFLLSVVFTQMLVAHSSFAAQGDPWQSHESIRRAAEQHVRDSGAIAGASRADIVARAMDDRLKLPACESALTSSTPYTATRSSRLTVEVACDSPRAWKIYVPVKLEVFAPVVVAARSLPRDAVLAAADITMEDRELASLTRGYVQDPAFVIGQKLKRPVNHGTTVTPNMLLTPPAIRRGQIVTVRAHSDAFSVAMTGTALQNGKLGEVIDITNNSSNRRVQAIVRSARVVEVLLK